MMEKSKNKEFIKMAIKESLKNRETNYKDGGPFGALIVKDEKIISIAHNTVIKSKDPTAHAEINAIRLAAKKLGTHDLKGCVLYVNAEPCPMCLSAIIWANIKKVYYANTKEDVANIGFRDDMIYDFIKKDKKGIIELVQIDREEAIKVFDEFKDFKGKIMY